MKLERIPVFYCDAMVAAVDSFSPSAGKPKAVLDSWRQLGTPLDCIEPQPVTRTELVLAHEAEFVDGVLAGRTLNGFGNISDEVTASLLYTNGSMLSAAQEAIRNRQVAVAPCAGFHHACYAMASGYCTFNGLMITALALRTAAHAKRIGILDFDMHYGDGTDDIIKSLGVNFVKHYSAGQWYRRASQAQQFLESIPEVVATMRDCDVILYQAGADPHVDDPLGGWLTTEQLLARDLSVFKTAHALSIPVAWNLAGGYQSPLRNVLDIHDNTLRACIAIYLE